MRYLSIRRVPKTLFDDDQPDLLIIEPRQWRELAWLHRSTVAEEVIRIAMLTAKLKLLDGPPHTL